jgi:hypothetical protein
MEMRDRVVSLDPADKAVPAAGLQMLIFDSTGEYAAHTLAITCGH